MADGTGGCDNSELGDNVFLEYSINGGTTWVLIATLYEYSYPLFTQLSFNIPSGVAISGCPMFKWYTFLPAALALSANGVSFLIGEAGICSPFSEIFGMMQK